MLVIIVLLLIVIAWILWALLKGLEKLQVTASTLWYEPFISRDAFPVFLYESIERQQARVSRLNKELERKEEEMCEHAEYADEIPNRDKSNSYKMIVRDYLEKKAECLTAIRVLHSMVEANWAVRSGRKTIDEAERHRFATIVQDLGNDAPSKAYARWEG